VDVLADRVLLTPADPAATRRFYGELLGLAVAREFGPPDQPGIVYFLGGGFLEVSGRAPAGERPNATVRLWAQVRDVAAEHERLLGAGVAITREPLREPWGLIEMWLEDPDGVPIVLVEIPADHPLRRDTRGGSGKAA
jgi:catechol 2,3-dioxygenase-like lactoylglutathione lyase family enzyme